MKHLSWILALLSGVLVLALVLLSAAAVFARYVLETPIQFTEEVSGILMIWIVFLGAICCEIDDEHLTIDMAVQWFSQRVQLWLSMLVGVSSIGLLCMMSWLSWKLAHSAALKKTQILGISWFWLDLAVVVGAVGIAIATAWRLWRIARHDEELPKPSAPSPNDIF